MKRALTRTGFEENPVRDVLGHGMVRRVLAPTQRLLARRGYRLVADITDSPTVAPGTRAPRFAETMIGLALLDNLQACVETAISDQVPGDLIETGVWRGGAAIFMRAVLAAYGVTDRKVWVADSFRGLPQSSHEADLSDGYKFDRMHEYAVPVETVKANFARYGLLDEQVRFLAGWFADTLPDAPIRQLAVVRLDGDLYTSTHDTISALYPKLSPGGFIVVDDYSFAACAKAVGDYRSEHGITETIVSVDGGAVFWRKERP